MVRKFGVYASESETDVNLYHFIVRDCPFGQARASRTTGTGGKKDPE
jgi:hypothetical protein